MDYFDFKKYFNDMYKITDDIWSMDDIEVVDYTGLDYDAKTLFFAKIDVDIDRNYNVLDPKKFAEKIYKSLCDRYSEKVIKMFFVNNGPLGGKYPDIAAKALMVAEGIKGFDLYVTNKRITSYQTGLVCSKDFKYSIIHKADLADLLNLTIREIYCYKENNKILLIDCYNMSYLTDLDTIANYLKTPVDKLYNTLYKTEVENIKYADDMEEALSNLGLDIIDKKAQDYSAEITFKYPNSNDIGIFEKYRIKFNVYKLIDGNKDDTRTLNDLCHFVKQTYFSFNTVEEAVEMLEKYIIKNR